MTVTELIRSPITDWGRCPSRRSAELRRTRLLSLSGPAGDELLAVLHRFGCNQPCALDCGAADWSGLDARLHYIAHLFRALHDDASLFDAPFTDVQLEAMSAGRLPDGTL